MAPTILFPANPFPFFFFFFDPSFPPSILPLQSTRNKCIRSRIYILFPTIWATPRDLILRRHVLVSSGPLLTPEQWEVCGVACYRACSNSLQELHQLTMAFSPRSESFYGDVAQVKVAARRDATVEESERLRQLAAQVCS